MTLWTAKNCGCTHQASLGAKRPKLCKHGNIFQSEKTQAQSNPATPRKGSGLKRSQPKRDWEFARTKVEEEGCCRICKRSDRKLEAAHVLGREHDEPMMIGERVTKTLIVHPDRIVPACGPFPEGCHGDVDMRRINLLPYLTLREQLQAVRDAGGIAPAYMRLAPVTHREEIEASASSHTEGVR